LQLGEGALGWRMGGGGADVLIEHNALAVHPLQGLEVPAARGLDAVPDQTRALLAAPAARRLERAASEDDCRADRLERVRLVTAYELETARSAQTSVAAERDELQRQVLLPSMPRAWTTRWPAWETVSPAELAYLTRLAMLSAVGELGAGFEVVGARRYSNVMAEEDYILSLRHLGERHPAVPGNELNAPRFVARRCGSLRQVLLWHGCGAVDGAGGWRRAARAPAAPTRPTTHGSGRASTWAAARRWRAVRRARPRGSRAPCGWAASRAPLGPCAARAARRTGRARTPRAACRARRWC